MTENPWGSHPKSVYTNLSIPELVEMAILRHEAKLTASGALRVQTGKYTGRSPNDKFIVDTPEVHNTIWWDNNKSISANQYAALYMKITEYLKDKDLFIFNGFAGAESAHTLPVQVINEYAWQNIFAQQLFIRPNAISQAKSGQPKLTVIVAPGFKADPEIDGTNSEAFVLINFTEKTIIIGGTHYAGEIKKSVFSVMNYLLPRSGVLSMHCSANAGPDNDVTLFFGLSGTGKTSLSADINRSLIGDDEHGWSDDGVFNIEGGCYAKCINLSKENEPQIWDAIRFGTVLENVSINETSRQEDFANDSLTENTRAAYPITYIPNSIYPGSGRHPRTIVFLTADAFGVLPPIAKLTPEQAMYYFLSGYTSKLAGTERGITEPQATFSACFGAPFLPLPPLEYAKLLREKILDHQTRVFLINTGWQGGAYGIGKRISIQLTRRMVSAAIGGYLDFVDYTIHPIFNLAIPTKCPGVPDSLLQPASTWQDEAAYRQQACRLAKLFHDNFASFAHMPTEIIQSGPFPLDNSCEIDAS